MQVLSPGSEGNQSVSGARAAWIKRLTGQPAWVLLIELFIGLGWLRAAAEKVIEPAWWQGEVIEQFVIEHTDVTIGWYAPFLDAVVLPFTSGIAVAVVAGQVIAGIALVSAHRRPIGLAVGMFLNLHFVAAGAVTPSAFYLLAQGALALWLCESSGAERQALRNAATAGAFFAGLHLPLISTLHPASVIEDPAVMFVLGGVLTSLTCLLAAGSLRRTTASDQDATPAHARDP